MWVVGIFSGPRAEAAGQLRESIRDAVSADRRKQFPMKEN